LYTFKNRCTKGDEHLLYKLRVKLFLKKNKESVMVGRADGVYELNEGVASELLPLVFLLSKAIAFGSDLQRGVREQRLLPGCLL
jgi:hypothetical protein